LEFIYDSQASETLKTKSALIRQSLIKIQDCYEELLLAWDKSTVIIRDISDWILFKQDQLKKTSGQLPEGVLFQVGPIYISIINFRNFFFENRPMVSWNRYFFGRSEVNFD